MHFVSFLYVRTYEVSVDDATGKKNILDKQVTGPLMCTDVTVELLESTEEKLLNNGNILDVIKDQYVEEDKQEYMLGYPALPPESKLYDPNAAAGDFKIISGHYYKPVKKDPNTPIVVQGDTSLEAKAKAREEALQPEAELTPFILAIPVSDKYMTDIIISHTPEGAITHFDSSKKETDPLLNVEEPTIPLDPLGLHVNEGK